MRERIIFCFLLGYLNCALANVSMKSCDDCTMILRCNAATAFISKRNAEATAKLQEQFCGRDDEGMPMVCCSALSPPESTRSGVETVDSVEGHPNLSLLSDTCGTIQANRLLGGHAAGLHEFPWLVLLSCTTRIGPQFNCVGSLINERYVLTAAHCLVNRTLLGVRVGDHNIDTDIDCEGSPPNVNCESNIQDIRIEEVVTHPGYMGLPRIKNDIALLRLKTKVVFSENALPICLPVTNATQNRDIGGLNATVVGWGLTETGYRSSLLLTVDVPVITQRSCSDLYNRGARVNDEDKTTNKLCTGTFGIDICAANSGGPLMFRGQFKNIPENRYIQHGIFSYGPLRCSSNFPDVYTDVTKYMKWILDTIRP